ncbi:Hypothetical protein EAG7_04958 [Klebsiella aerogenes]|mgnify:CR=1 FL=1|nr:Hypothetical protein EAG7_04958 [Klebsiella aerogenes]
MTFVTLKMFIIVIVLTLIMLMIQINLIDAFFGLSAKDEDC